MPTPTPKSSWELRYPNQAAPPPGKYFMTKEQQKRKKKEKQQHIHYSTAAKATFVFLSGF